MRTAGGDIESSTDILLCKIIDKFFIDSGVVDGSWLPEHWDQMAMLGSLKPHSTPGMVRVILLCFPLLKIRNDTRMDIDSVDSGNIF